jgi:hypothetical protein
MMQKDYPNVGQVYELNDKRLSNENIYAMKETQKVGSSQLRLPLIPKVAPAGSVPVAAFPKLQLNSIMSPQPIRREEAEYKLEDGLNHNAPSTVNMPRRA